MKTKQEFLRLKKINIEEFVKILANESWEKLSKKFEIPKKQLRSYFYNSITRNRELSRYKQININAAYKRPDGLRRIQNIFVIEKEVRLWTKCFQESLAAGLKIYPGGAGETCARDFAFDIYKKSGGLFNNKLAIYNASRNWCLKKGLCGNNSVPKGSMDVHHLAMNYFKAPVNVSEIPGLVKTEKPIQKAESDLKIKQLFFKKKVNIDGEDVIAFVPANEYIEKLMKNPKDSIISLLKKQGELIEL